MSGCRHHLNALHGGEFALPGTEPSYAPDLGLEPSHIEIRLRFDVENQSAEGSVTTTVVARRAERTLELDAVDLLGVQVSDPDGNACSASYDGSKLRVTWADTPSVGDERRVTVSYRVEQPLTGMLFSWPDAAYPQRGKWVATDHETERARYWLPCVDHPAVRTPLDLYLTANEDYTILANGTLVDEGSKGGVKTAHWRLEQPCPSYLICMAVGEFVRAEGGAHEGVEVALFAEQRHGVEDLQRSFGTTQAMLEWMTAKLGAPFPYPKYYQIALPGIGGAMENISLTTWDDCFIVDETLHEEWGRIVERINVHEMAHSYFGDAIVISDFAHAWLKESWATYVEALWVEDRHGVDEMHYQLHCEGEDYMGESDERYARPIVTKHYTSSWDMFDQHLYPGGCWRIHMLRHKVGEEAFWAAVQDYVASYTGKLVETADFRRALEKHSGLNLTRFFDQWLHGPGYPKLKVELRHDAEKGEARLVVEQTQVKKNKKDIGLFSFDLEIALETAEDRWETVLVPVSEARHTRVIPLASEPLQAVVDPEQKVLFRLEFDPGSEMLERSLKKAPVVGRIHAAQTLGKKGKRSGVSALEKAWGQEELWGVRVAAAKALGKAGSQEAAEALGRLLGVEQDARVLGSIAEACGSYRDAGVAGALEAFLTGERPYYLARAAALRSLGKQRGDDYLKTLAAGADDDSWWGWVKRGAMIGLGETRSEAGRKILMERVLSGQESRQVRTQAILGLASAAFWLERGPRLETLERLVDVSRDADYKVRVHAARALANLGEARGLGALSALTERVSVQDVPRVRRMIESLRKRASGTNDAGKLKKRVEELEDKLRKLGNRVESLESRNGKKS